MGTRRRALRERLAVRITKAIEDRETLLYCRACDGDGIQKIKTAQGVRQELCRWCEYGYTDRETAKLYARWLRIRAANHLDD